MTTTKEAGSWAAAAVIAAMLAALAAGCSTATAAKPEMEVISGTGNFQGQAQTTVETLPPAGVLFQTRVGKGGAFTGWLTGGVNTVTWNLRNQNPPESVFYGEFKMRNATVGDRHGALDLEVKGSSQGNVAVTPGTHSIFQVTVLRGSGDFEGARGHGLMIGKTYLASSGITYWLQLEVPKK